MKEFSESYITLFFKICIVLSYDIAHSRQGWNSVDLLVSLAMKYTQHASVVNRVCELFPTTVGFTYPLTSHNSSNCNFVITLFLLRSFSVLRFWSFFSFCRLSFHHPWRSHRAPMKNVASVSGSALVVDPGVNIRHRSGTTSDKAPLLTTVVWSWIPDWTVPDSKSTYANFSEPRQLNAVIINGRNAIMCDQFGMIYDIDTKG